MKKTAFLLLLASSLFIPKVSGQFHVQFSDPSFTAKGYQAVYSFESGQLLMLTDDSTARQEGYIFLNPKTGAKLSSFRLDNDHGPMLTPNGGELLVVGSDASVRTMGRYEPATLQLIERVGIKLGDTLANTIGIGGQFEPTPDGNFVFSGVDTPGAVNFIAKYGVDFQQDWATSFTYKGSYSSVGVETYPLPGGDIGFYVFFNMLNPMTSQLEIVDVFGLLDGDTGALKWTFSYRPPLGSGGNRLENFRFTFGSDGSFFAHAAATINIFDISAPVDYSKAKVVRIKPDGTLAYSKTLSVNDAVVLGEHYMDGYAVLHFGFNDEDNTQFVVLDSNGAITGNTAIGYHLSAGDGDLTATRRSGTDFAFVRASFSPGGETLGRLNLANGAMEFRQLPSPFPGNPEFEAVGRSGSYAVAPFNTPGGLSAVSKVLAAEVLNSLSSDYKMDLVELPEDGSFPTCITYTPSPITTITPLAATLSEVEFIDLQDGWTPASHGGLPGLGASDIAPAFVAMDVTVNFICEDDGTTTIDPGNVTLIKINATEGELSFDTSAGATYKVQKRTKLDGVETFTTMETVVGDGQPHTITVPLTDGESYFRYELEVTP